MNSFRFAAVISHPIQHFSPIFRELAKKPGVEVKVFYLCDHGVTESYDDGFGVSFAWDVPLTQGYEYEYLRPGFSPRKFGFFEMDHPDLGAYLDDFHPDLIWLHGYSQRMCWRAQRWAKQNHCSVLYFGDSELLHDRATLSKAIKRLVLPYFFSRCDAFMTIGDNNADYYEHYGVTAEKLVKAACPVEMSRFTVSSQQRDMFQEEVRGLLGIPAGDTVIVFSGKLQEHKRPLDLIRALRIVNDASVHLMFIGDGPLRSSLLEEAAVLGLKSRVHLAGFINQAHIPKYLAAGDIMALPSGKEPFGLVVSESLPFGMPIIASDRVGCVGPNAAARPGVNALIYPVGDEAMLAASIRQLVNNDDMRASYGLASREIAATQDVSVTVEAIMKVAQRC